jgi:cytochrome c553
MNYVRSSVFAVLSLALALPIGLQAAGDPVRGQGLSQACAACHGSDGNSVNPEWPKIAGQHASYIHKQLMDYKSGRRENALMAAQVANLNEQDMRDLSAFYTQQQMSPGTADESVAERGERIYRGGIPRPASPPAWPATVPTARETPRRCSRGSADSTPGTVPTSCAISAVASARMTMDA